MTLETRALRDRLERALARDRAREALEVLEELERLEPGRARWPHRRGDLARRLGRTAEATSAYERAVSLYVDEGFITRAIALAKLIGELYPERSDVLERLDPEAARKLREEHGGVAEPRGTIDLSLPEPRLYLPVTDDLPAGTLVLVDATAGIELSELEVLPRSATPHPRAAAVVLIDDAAPTADALASLPAFPLFSEAPREALLELVRGADLLELAHGEKVVRQGEPAEALFAIVEGSVRVEVPGLAADEQPILGEGDVFGETCLLEDQARTADVVVEGHVSMLRVGRDTLARAVDRYPRIGEILFDLLTRRLIGNLMRSAPLFAAFDGAARREIARHFVLRRVPAGTTLVTEGTPSDALYIPLTGRLEIVKGGRVESCAPGEILGLESLFGREPSPLTATTRQEIALLSLPRERFARVVCQYPPMLAHLTETAWAP